MSGAYACMLDTNAASTLIRGRAGPALQTLMTEQGACISVITEAEVRFGVKRRPDATRLAKAAETFLQDTPVLPWTSATAHVYAELRTRMETKGIGLSAMDLLIATHALAEDCTLISADRAFARVPGLRVLDLSADEGSAASDTSERGGGKLAQESMAPYAVRGAVAHARTIAPKSSRKPKPGRKPKAK